MNPILHLSLAGCLSLALFVIATPPRLFAQAGDYVTRSEYEKLLREVAALRSLLGQAATAQTEQKKEAEVTADEFERELRVTKSLLNSVQPGSSRFLVAGYGSGGFTSFKGQDSTFQSALTPLLLWRLNNRLLFEAEPEFELEGSETEVMLEYANVSYILNDYVTLKAGKFLTPFGIFPERLHPAWINKLPDGPLVYREEGGIAPISSVGVQASGNIPLGDMSAVYSFYAANGPGLNHGDDEPEEVGMLTFDNNTDDNNNKAIGGRLALRRVLPGLEFGYSFLRGGVRADGSSPLFFLQAADIAYVRDSDALRGVIDLRGEWVWSSVRRAIYDDRGRAGFGPLSFRNRRTGGYAQLAYRPSKVEPQWCRDFEFIARRDLIDQPVGPPESTDQRRWTLGLNYWLTSSAVVKAAFDWVTLIEHDRETTRGFRLQAVMGF